MRPSVGGGGGVESATVPPSPDREEERKEKGRFATPFIRVWLSGTDSVLTDVMMDVMWKYAHVCQKAPYLQVHYAQPLIKTVWYV